MGKKVSMLDVLVLMLFVNVVKGYEDTFQCINHTETCSLHGERPCCDKNANCKWLDSENRYQCLKKVKLGDPCHISHDCSITLHSICSLAQKCACRPNYVQVNGTRCAPLLDEFCWKELCAPENSRCIDNKCKCTSGFLAQSNDQCVSILLQLHCESDAECESIAFSRCSNKKCVCSKYTVAINPSYCSLPIGEFCGNNRECGIINSECVDNICQCKSPYIPYSNNYECAASYLRMPCERSIYCETRIKNTECIDNACECSANYVPWEDNSCLPLLDLSCKDDRDCLKSNFACINNICQCTPDYLLLNGKCLPKYLAGLCKETSDCSNIKFAECLKGQCICNGGFKPFNRTTCSRILGTICSVDEDCMIRNSYCYQNLCECHDGYIQESQILCLPTDLKGFCLNDADCKLIPNARCSSKKKCVCKKNFVKMNQISCAPLLNESCSNESQCAIANSFCIDNKCQCDSENSERLDGRCADTFLDKLCSLDADCNDIPYAKCSNASKCVCDSNYVQLRSSICLPLLGGYCKRNSECLTRNSVCIKNKCQCDFAFTTKLFNKCEPISLGQLCESDVNCKQIQKATCSQNKICVCESDTFALDKMTCVPELNTYCTFDECKIESSHCLDNKCQCKPGYSAMSINQCVRIQSLYSCSDVSDCVEHWHFECSQEKKCVCKLNNIATKNSTCLPILDGYCWKQDQCNVKNSDCVDFRCRCTLGSNRISKNMCAFDY